MVPFQTGDGMQNKTFTPETLTELAFVLMKSSGLSDDDSRTIAEDLVAAELRGLASHGVSRIPMYLNRLSLDLVKINPRITVERVANSALKVNGDDGMGFIVSHRAIEEGIKVAKETGLCLVGINHSTHFGMAALYVKQALEAGLNSIIFTNSSPALAPFGGKATFLGAAPLAAGMVGGNNAPPYVLDMAMTVIARGKIRVAMTNKEKIPEGLALDSEGRPTTDPEEAFKGVCLPFGGVKGSSLAMLMDLIAGLYTGAGFGGEVKSLYYDHSVPQNVGHLFFLFRPDLFMSLEEYKNRMDHFYDNLKAVPLAAGFDEILMPGEPEARKESFYRKNGIAVSANILEDLSKCAQERGVDISSFI